MKWMDSLLQEGHLSGKISCPNKRCSSKLGNYDWAGMRCGCNEWVVPVCPLFPVSLRPVIKVPSLRHFVLIGQKSMRFLFEFIYPEGICTCRS